MVAQGQLSFMGVVASGVLGFLLSILPWYCAGRFLGEKRLKKLVQRHSRWLSLPTQDISKGKRWFRRHGGKALILGLFIPGSRNLIALPAGLSGMSIPTFLLYTTTGAILWLSSLTAMGYFLGDRYHLVEEHFNSVSSLIPVVVIVAVCIGVLVYYWQRKGRSFTSSRKG